MKKMNIAQMEQVNGGAVYKFKPVTPGQRHCAPVKK